MPANFLANMEGGCLCQKQPPKVFYKKTVLKIFVGKHLCGVSF